MNVLVAGSGALGSWIGLLLARSDWEFTIIDDDRVGSENLSTSAFSRHHVGAYKAVVLAEMMWHKARAQVVVDTLTLSAADRVMGYDLVVDSFDNVEARGLTIAAPCVVHVGVSADRTGAVIARYLVEEKGYVLLGWSEIGFVYLLSNVPVTSVKQLKGAKVWSLEGDPLASPVLRKAGVTPIPLSIPDVLMALQTNLIDVVYASPLAAIALQWFTKVKYMTNLPLIYSLGGVLVSKRVFGKIPPSLQEAVRHVFRKHTSLLNAHTRRKNEEAIGVMVKHGIKLITPTDEETGEFKGISLEAINELAGKAFSKDVITEVRSHLNQYRTGPKGK